MMKFYKCISTVLILILRHMLTEIAQAVGVADQPATHVQNHVHGIVKHWMRH